MTPAVIEARRQGIEVEIHEYSHDPGATSYGQEAVKKLGVEAVTVFKTLIVESDQKNLAVGIVPVLKELDLKAMASALGVKKVQMADKLKVQRTTGYVLGGVSPLGQKKKLPTVIDQSAKGLQKIFVSGGRRGLDIALTPAQLALLSNAKFSPIARSGKNIL